MVNFIDSNTLIYRLRVYFIMILGSVSNLSNFWKVKFFKFRNGKNISYNHYQTLLISDSPKNTSTTWLLLILLICLGTT